MPTPLYLLKIFRPKTLILTCLLVFSSLEAGIIERICHLRHGPHTFALGPQTYYLKRSRSNGSYQDGWMYGFAATYDRRRPMGFYWATRYFWADGTLEGKTTSGATQKSDKEDREFEGRFGFTLGSREGCWYGTMVTLFAGGSVLDGSNKWQSPSPLTYHFRAHVETWNGGILVTIDPLCWLRIGVDYTVKVMIEGKNKVTNDPPFDDSKAVIGNRVHHAVELPVIFRCLGSCGQFEASVLPFYRFRHYGFRENAPNDYYSTRFHSWGLRAGLAYTF